jgi:polyisoprenoid-binding protein YceI
MSGAGARWPIVVVVVCACLAMTGPARSQAPAPATRLEIAAGSRAEYRVREQLARLNFPNDAVGTTDAVSGVLVVAPDGSFASGSKLTVDLRTLRSDEGRRDAYLRDNTLQTARFPLAEFVPRRQKGLAAPLPASGMAAFQLIGDMTLHGVTSELSWDVTATFAADSASGKAATRFPFARFNLTIPRLLGLISVDDDIRIELAFKARRVGG